MTILLVGGGSGGHITPLLAVAQELKKIRPDATLVYIGQRGDRLSDIPTHDPNIDAVYSVRAGKFRRYHGESVLRQVSNIPTMAKNFRDAGRTVMGLTRSYQLLRKLHPDLIFIKGGYVGVPVGLAAARLKIPYITHDSDAIPGLANRIIARWAALHTVALPKEIYPYPAAKTFSVGVPVQADFQKVSDKLQAKYRREIGLEKFKEIIFITGGGQGARHLNELIATCLPHILEHYPNMAVVQTAGRLHEDHIRQIYAAKLSKSNQTRVFVKGYVEDLYHYSGAADLIITRAGATSIAEFAIQAKACIFIPNPYLTGGHQLKNAALLQSERAAEVVAESKEKTNADNLMKAVSKLMDSPVLRKELGDNLHSLAHPRAAHELAELLLSMARTTGQTAARKSK